MKRSHRDAKGTKPVLSMRGHYFRNEPVKVDKVDRNGPCPCGSGLKYKKCCAQGTGLFKRLWQSIFRRRAAPAPPDKPTEGES